VEPRGGRVACALPNTAGPGMRVYRDARDYWRIRDFLREVFLLNGRRELSWQVYRFDYWRWHGIENMGHGRLEDDVFLWEKTDGRLVGVLNREGPGQAFLQVHPAHHGAELEEEMMAVAEAHLAAGEEGGPGAVRVWTDQADWLRHDILRRRGYAVAGEPEHQRRRPVSLPIPDTPVPAGYAVRSLGGTEEVPARSYASWRAFHPDEPDERYQGPGWYANIQRAPLYRRDLDIVAVAAGGDIASFCTVWFDDVTRTGAFEPVGTVPEHRGRGLGKAVMYEGLRRLRRMGATQAHVGSYDGPAHALYAAVGFAEYDLSEPWRKEL
jgi:mycothiol synthase